MEDGARWSECRSGLRAETKGARRSALDALLGKLREAVAPDESAFRELHEDVLALLADETEACRQRAASAVAELLRLSPPSEFVLTYTIPAVRARLAGPETVEYSEELRLGTMDLLRSVAEAYAGTPHLRPFYDDFVDVLIVGCADDFAEVKKCACAAIVSLAAAVSEDFHMRAEALASAAVAAASHQHSKVRIEAIKAIGAIVLNGNDSCFDIVISQMTLLMLVENNGVRLQVIREVGNWMLNFRSRYSYWCRMIPIILTGISDEIEDIQLESKSLWENVGLQYMKENEEELKSQMDNLGNKPRHYPSVARPNLGCRILIIKNIGKIIPAIVRELEDWKFEVRLKSAKILSWLILCSESKCMQYSNDIMNCFLQGTKYDQDEKVVEEICRSCEYFSYFIGPDIWWNLLSSELDSCAGLVILTYLIKGTSVEELRPKYLKRILKELCCPRLVNSQKLRQLNRQSSLLSVCESLMDVCTIYCKSVTDYIFGIIFSIYSIPVSQEVKERALALIEKLRETIKVGSNLDEFYCIYIRSVLTNLMTSEAFFWNPETLEKYILIALLIETGPSIGLHLHLLSPLLVEILACKNVDEKVKLQVFTSLSTALLNRDERFKLSDPEKLNAFMNIILEDIIVPNLKWCVGKTAEALREAAVVCLCALLQDSESICQTVEEASFNECMKPIQLFPDQISLQNHVNIVLPILISLLNDNSKGTRQHALKAIHCLVKLAKKSNCFSLDHLHTSYAEIISRLDDSNDKVRRFAIETLCTLFLSRPEPYDTTTYNAHIDALYNALLIHLDDPNPTIQEDVLVALKKICTVHPTLLKGKVSANTNIYKNIKALEHLDKHLESLVI